MSADEKAPAASEQVYSPRPSWGAAFFAAGATVAVCGIYAEGFMFRGWVWAIFAGIVALFALRSLIRGAVHDFFRLPRRQKTRGAVLPVTAIKNKRP